MCTVMLVAALFLEELAGDTRFFAGRCLWFFKPSDTVIKPYLLPILNSISQGFGYTFTHPNPVIIK